MNKREYMFFKNEMDITIEKFSPSFSKALLPFPTFDSRKTEKEFRYSIKRLLVKYNLLDKDNQIKVDQNCLDCDDTKFSCFKEISEENIVKIDVDELFTNIYEKYFKNNLFSFSPSIAMIAAPFLDSISSLTRFNNFQKHIRCILLRTAEIELENNIEN